MSWNYMNKVGQHGKYQTLKLTSALQSAQWKYTRAQCRRDNLGKTVLPWQRLRLLYFGHTLGWLSSIPFLRFNVFFFPHDVLVRRPENALVVILGVISTILDSPDSLKMVTIGTHRYPKWNGHANKGNTCQTFCRERIIACLDCQIGSTWENSWWAALFLGSEGPNGLVAHSQSWLMT